MRLDGVPAARRATGPTAILRLLRVRQWVKNGFVLAPLFFGVELLNRRPTGRTFHRYLNPERPVDEGARAVHGLTDEFLAGQPKFAEIAAEFIEFIKGAELIAQIGRASCRERV